MTKLFILFLLLMILSGCGEVAKTTAPFYVGLWKAEKAWSVDLTAEKYTEEFTEVTVTEEMPIYVGFTIDGKWCSQWSSIVLEELECAKWDSYTANENILNMQQEGLEGPPWRYKWKNLNGKLELISEILMDGKWSPIIKYVLIPAQK